MLKANAANPAVVDSVALADAVATMAPSDPKVTPGSRAHQVRKARWACKESKDLVVSSECLVRPD